MPTIPVESVPHFIEIIDVGCKRNVLGHHLVRGSPTSPLVVVDEPECICQSIQIGQEIPMIEIRTAVEDDERLSPPDFSRIERCLSGLNTALARRHGKGCGRLGDGHRCRQRRSLSYGQK